MPRHPLRTLVVYLTVIVALAASAFADDQPANRAIQEEVWAIPATLPTFAYVVRPVGDGPFPLVVMNHGVSLNQHERSFFPLVEFRDAAMWFARRGYMVVAPSGSGYGAAALDDPERGLYSIRSAAATIRTFAMPGLRWPSSTSGSSNTWPIRS